MWLIVDLYTPFVFNDIKFDGNDYTIFTSTFQHSRLGPGVI